MTARPLGFGIVGCGGAAVDVAAAIARSGVARLVAAHDLQPELAEDLAAPAGAAVHQSLEGLLGDAAVQAVYVALPHDLLAEVAAQALAAGRPALVEKPMAIDVAGIERLRSQAHAAGLALGVLYELRETGQARLAARLVGEGAIGEVTAVRIRTIIDKPQAYWSSGLRGRSRSPWRASAARAGGGVVLMNTVHQLDLVAFITGLEVVNARGEVGTLAADPRQVDVEDTAAAVLRFSNGAIGSLAAGAHSPGAADGETIEIDGREGSLHLPDLYGEADLALFLRRPHTDLPAGRWLALPAGPADPFRAAITAFSEAVLGGQPAPVGAADAARALATVERVYAASSRP